MTTAPDERRFTTFTRGAVRDEIILAHYRNALRNLTNPDTGVVFTEDEIQVATQPGSRFYIDADSIDIYGQSMQARALWFASQQDPRLANTTYLENQHGRLWLGLDSRLPATGGSATDGVSAVATPGSTFVGSTTVPDPTASVATDPNGFRFQVLQTLVTPASGIATLSMQGIDTGLVTNLTPNTILTWAQNQPLGADPQATVAIQFTGGFEEESDSEYADRIEQRIRFRPASGNNAHFVAWAREANVAVEDAFIYATALNAGSVLAAITQKRGTSTGPLVRIPSIGTLTDVSNYLVPPNSPVVPERAYVVTTTVTSQGSNLVIQISLNQGSSGGWLDVDPWPTYTANYPQVQVLSSPAPTSTTFSVNTDVALPGGVGSLSGDDAPSLMLWNKTLSRFEKLDVLSVTDTGIQIDIILNQAPTMTIAAGDHLSPYTDRLIVIAESLEDYFDTLGPGEVIDLDTDHRAARALRFPTPAQQSPSRAGSALLVPLLEVLGGLATSAELTVISRNDPDLPNDIVDGPNIVTLGDVNIHPL